MQEYVFCWFFSNYVEDYLFPYCTPSLIGITTDFFLHHRVPGINAEHSMLAFFALMLSAASGVRDLRESRFRARSALSSRRARNSKKNANRGLCASLRTVILQSFARRRASRAEEWCFARGCSRVHFFTCFFHEYVL